MAELTHQSFREAFPYFKREDALCYLDNAATTQKPGVVIARMTDYWSSGVANIHRSSHLLAERATEAFEQSRTDIARFINADSKDIIFTKGSTESINLLSYALSSEFKPDDAIIISAQEHHANILPWRRLCEEQELELRVWQSDGLELDTQALIPLLDGARLLCVNHICNSTGAVNDLSSIIELAHGAGCQVMVDAAQSIAHIPIDVKALDCDFLVFSGHKCFGPEGTGVLFCPKALADSLPPWQLGGEMVETVSFDRVSFQESPLRFEAGTPNIAGVLGLAEALRFIASYDRAALHQHEQSLVRLAHERLSRLPGFKLYSPSSLDSSILSFGFEGIHSADMTALLDAQSIAIRAGMLCAMPWVKQLSGNSGILRLSVAPYNLAREIEQAVEAISEALEILG